MALITAQLTLTGAAQGDNLASVALANGAALGDKGIRHMVITAPAANITYGPQVNGTFTTTPDTIVATKTQIIGPFSGDAPTRTKEWFFKGTSSQVVTITLITH
jgi:hypothetical protein